MRCAICDQKLHEAEIYFNWKHDNWSPCGECLEVVASLNRPSASNLWEEAENTLDEEPDGESPVPKTY
jgi:cytidine deaminase